MMTPDCNGCVTRVDLNFLVSRVPSVACNLTMVFTTHLLTDGRASLICIKSHIREQPMNEINFHWLRGTGIYPTRVA